MRANFLAAVTVGAALTAAPALSDTLRIASFTPEGAVGVQHVMIPWMEAVEADLGDRIDLVPFWGGALGSNPFEQFDLVRDGVIDVAWILAGYTPGQFPQLQITELPFTVATGEEASVVGWRLFETGLIDGLEDVHVLTVWTPDITAIHLNDPIDTLEELSGTALRTSGSTQAMFVEALGAAPQTLGSVEANEAQGRGTIDGQLQGWTGMNTFGGFDVSSAAYNGPFGAAPFVLLMNKSTWDGLPDDVQEVMMTHAGEPLARAGGRAYDEITEGIIDRQTAEGYTVVEASEADIERYLEQYGTVHDTWIENTPNGQEVYDTFMQLLEDYRAEQ